MPEPGIIREADVDDDEVDLQKLKVEPLAKADRIGLAKFFGRTTMVCEG